MARPREVKALTRPERITLHADVALARDLDRVASEWGVPIATACYWLLKGIIADCRGERFVMIGDTMSERLGRYLFAHFEGR